MSDKKQVLVICRSAAGQMYLGVLLNRIWYSPVLVKTAEEGIRLSHSNSFTLIILDGDLPESELHSAIALVKAEPAIKDIPLVAFITTEGSIGNESLIAEGCSAVLTKPLDLALVYGILGRLSGQPRNTPRIPVKMRVEIEEGTPEKALSCVNLSEGGLYLRTHQPLPENTLLHLIFTLPRDTQELKLAAEVVRTAPLGIQIETEPGMGLRFVDMSEETRRHLRNFVQWEMMGDLEWEANI